MSSRRLWRFLMQPRSHLPRPIHLGEWGDFRKHFWYHVLPQNDFEKPWGISSAFRDTSISWTPHHRTTEYKQFPFPVQQGDQKWPHLQSSLNLQYQLDWGAAVRKFFDQSSLIQGKERVHIAFWPSAMQRNRRTRLDVGSTTTRPVLKLRKLFKQLAWRSGIGGSSRPPKWLSLNMWASSLQGIETWKFYLQDGLRWIKKKLEKNASWRAAALFKGLERSSLQTDSPKGSSALLQWSRATLPEVQWVGAGDVGFLARNWHCSHFGLKLPHQQFLIYLLKKAERPFTCPLLLAEKAVCGTCDVPRGFWKGFHETLLACLWDTSLQLK